MRSVALALYRIAWEPALLALRALALFERIAGTDALPARWRPRERLETPRSKIPRLGEAPTPCLWLHAASLGECKGLWAFAQSLAGRDERDGLDGSAGFPCGFVLTVNTVEALEFLRARIAASDEPERWQARLAPPDHPRVVRRFLAACEVRGVILFEVELWPNFIRESRRENIPVFWISARLTRRAAKRYGRFPAALRAVLRDVAWTQAQGAREADALRAFGCGRVEVGGDLRGLPYLGEARGNAGDATAEDPARAVDENASPASGARDGFAFVSFHADELDALRALIANARAPLYVLPRKRGEFARFAAALAPLGFELSSRRPDAPRQIVDAFGRTGAILARVRGAVVGGSFADHGGHNLWEPLAAGVPSAIGRWHESQEYLVSRLDARGLLRVVKEIPPGGVEALFPPLTPLTATSAREAFPRAAERERAVLLAAAAAAREAIKQRVSFGEGP